MEMAHFKKYTRSFKCLVRVNCVSPFIIIILIDSTYVRFKQSNCLFHKILLIFSHN